MACGKYRKYDKLLKSEMAEYADDEIFVLLSDVIDSINEIESKVDTIIDTIEEIAGLDIIDEIRKQLKTLSEELY